jgi:hypothetical protein
MGEVKGVCMIDKTAIGKALTEMISLADILYLAKKEVLSHTRNEEYLKTIVSMIEDARDALAAIEADKPAEDAEEVAISIANLFSTYTLRNDKHLPASVEAAQLLMNFAESYHAEQCKACKK